MTKPTLNGIVDFSTPIICSADSLGQSVDISIGGHTGTLTLPSLPDWGEEVKTLLFKTLLGPTQARTWKRGKDLIYWGSPISYPDGVSEVKRALFEFFVAPDNFELAAQEIYAGFGAWLNLFAKYVKLLSFQNSHASVSVSGGFGRIEILANEDAVLRRIFSTQKPQAISVAINGTDGSLHLELLREASRLSSQRLSPRFEYLLLLEAYDALGNRDFRKAIIEAANALEICLTGRIMEEFDTQNITFGDKLLQKFRMLGGRFELIKLLGISLPNKDYESLVNKPRNDVVHRGSFPKKVLANKVVTEVEKLLRLLSPQIYQDRPEV